MLILGSITEAFTAAGLWMVTGIYKIAAVVFELFLILATGELLDRNVYKTMLTNFYVLIGIIMLFIIAFSLLQSMIKPDDQNKSASSIKKVIINLITSLILMAILPTIFSFAYDFQNSFINGYNVIGKFFGYGNVNANEGPTSDTNIDLIKKGSYKMVNGVYTAFLNVDVGSDKCKVTDTNSLIACQEKYKTATAYTYETSKTRTKKSFYETIIEVDNTGRFDHYVDFSTHVDEGYLDFNFLMSLIAGFLLVYVGISFCFDMAVRLVKLVFYQLIAPIPIFFRIVPEGKLSNTFNQWTKVTITCYLEVFVRIFVFYFCVYLCAAMLKSDFLVDDVFSFGIFQGLLAKAFVLMGIVTFMKSAPKLISEITGLDSGNMKLGIKDKLKDSSILNLASTGAGFIGGMIAGKGNPLAGYRAAKHGWKNGNLQGIGSEVKRKQAYKDALNSGATRRQIALNTLREKFGLDSTAEASERKIKTGATSVENNSPSNIVYTDATGKTYTILSGSNAQIDDVTAEELKSKKTQNIGAMTAANDKMRDLDNKIKYAKAQKEWKAVMDEEADKKFNDGKYEHRIRYQDSDGNIKEELVNGKRLSELSQQGMKFLNSDGKIVTEKKIRDEIRASFSKQELSSNSPNLIKNKTESFFNTLANEGGFNYQSYVYDKDGRQIYKDGKAVIETGGFTSKIDKDNNRIITHTYMDSDGKSQEITYTSVGNGMLKYEDSDGKTKELSIYDLSDMFDQKSKSTSGVLEAQKQKIAEGEEFIKARDENDAIDAILKQRDEKIAEALQSQKQRGKEAAKKYKANNK